MPNVQVLLKESVDKLGDIGEIVTVKPGYARNYLLPQGLATLPTIGEIRSVKKKKEKIEKINKETKAKAEEINSKLLEIASIEIKAKAGESGKLFGAITAKEIAEVLNEKLGEEFKLDKKQVNLKRGIHEVGKYPVKIKLHPEVSTEIEVVVSPESQS